MREEADKIEAALCRLGDGEAIPSDAFPLPFKANYIHNGFLPTAVLRKDDRDARIQSHTEEGAIYRRSNVIFSVAPRCRDAVGLTSGGGGGRWQAATGVC